MREFLSEKASLLTPLTLELYRDALKVNSVAEIDKDGLTSEETAYTTLPVDSFPNGLICAMMGVS